MMRSKKGISNVFAIVGEIVLVCVILIVMIYIITGGFKNFRDSLNSCRAKGGVCLASCGELEPRPAGDPACEKAKQVCCMSQDEAGVIELASGTGANNDLIVVTLSDGLNKEQILSYGQTVEVEIGKTYFLNVKIDKQLRPKPEIKYCGIWADSAGERYALYNLGANYSKSEFKSMKEEFPLSAVNDQITENGKTSDQTVAVCSKAGTNDQLTLYTRAVTFQDLDAGKTYNINYAVYNAIVTDAINKSSSGDKKKITYEALLEVNDKKNWLGHFQASLHVRPIIQIEDIGRTWAQFDDITVKAFSPYKLTNISVGITRQEKWDKNIKEESNLYKQLQMACAGVPHSPTLHKITSMKAGNPGVNTGLFVFGAKNYQQMMYESQAQAIPIADNIAKVHIDASTIVHEFPNEGADLLTETNETTGLNNHFLCVRATVVSDKNAQSKTIHTFSTQPLMLDVAPPLIDNTDEYIQIVYPKPIQTQVQDLVSQGMIAAGQTVTPFHFEEYPKVAIKKCVDKSGCKYYDYHFAPTNIKVNVNAQGTEEIIFASVIGLGLNELYRHFKERNPLDSVCPLPASNSYRRNTYPEIRFGTDKQGIYCIRVSDGAGNYWLTWKPVYAPYDVVEKNLRNATTRITPVIS